MIEELWMAGELTDTELEDHFIDDCGKEDGRWAAASKFVVSRGHGPVSPAAVDAALDRVLSLVALRVELRWLAAARAAVFAVAGLVGLVRDGAADPAPPQVSAVLPGGVDIRD
ncbi:hypothetical protein AB0M61_16715 [Streptomyces sp. NPDC051642]|uniref:hypothetical protein n=1 Tax=Streptomyces sp. NPDC051642 TaxID=3154646 RepID=UPI0034340E02